MELPCVSRKYKANIRAWNSGAVTLDSHAEQMNIALSFQSVYKSTWMLFKRHTVQLGRYFNASPRHMILRNYYLKHETFKYAVFDLNLQLKHPFLL